MNNKTLWLRIVVLMLALSMVLMTFIGCSNDDEDQLDNFVTTDGGEGDYDSNGFLRDKLPDELDYEGEEVTFFTWNNQGITEFEVKELNGIAIDEAVFKRNLTIEERLGVKLVFETYTAGGAYEYPAAIEKTVSAGLPYDVLAGHMRSMSLTAIQGYMTDFSSIENSYADFTAPWWNQSLIEKTSVGNTFFLATGDIAASYPQMLYCIYFNVELMGEFGLDSPYDLVENNEWTLENMLLMNMNFYQDNNNNSAVDLNDDLPLVGQYYDWPALLHGCDVGIVEKDATGAFVFDANFIGEKSVDIMQALADAISLDNAYVGEDTDINSHFIDEKSIFYITDSGKATRAFADIEFEYGCVPCPKYDSEQTDYISTARQSLSLFGTSKGIDADRLSMISAVLECMASEGYRQVTPVVFEEVMKYQKSASPEMTEMLELIKDTATFDVGRIYFSHLDGVADWIGRKLQAQENWSTYLNGTVKTTIQNKLNQLSDTLIEVAN